MKKFYNGLSVILFIIFTISCESSNEIENKKPVITELRVKSDSLGYNEITEISCFVTDENQELLSYEWISSGGVISGSGKKIIWQSPSEEGQYKILCNVSDDEFLVSANVSINVISYSPVIKNLSASKELIEVGGVSELICDAGDKYGELVYEWFTDQGEIIGSGNKVNWIAPNTVGSFRLKCKVTNIHNESSTESIIIKTKTTPIYFYAGDYICSCNTDGSEFRYLANGSYQFFYDENTLMYLDKNHNLKTYNINTGSINLIHSLTERTVYHNKISDKEMLVFYFHKSNGERDLGTFNLTTESFNYIYEKKNNQVGAVANIDDWIYFLDGSHSNDSEYKINRISLNGFVDPNFEIIESGYSYSYFSISDNGEKIYTAKKGARNYISIIKIDNREEKLIEVLGFESISFVHISKDDDYILFVGINGTDRNIYKINADGSNLVKITNKTNMKISKPITWNHY